MSPTTTERASETQCQATIVQAAKIGGWLVHAERPAQSQRGRWVTPVQGHKGFPDLVLARGDRLLIVELKRKPNRVEPEQAAWHEALRACGCDVRVVWVPEQMGELCTELVTR